MPHRRNRSDGTNESRRKFLKASGAGAVALSLAGCSGDGNQETTETTETTDGGGEDTETTTDQPETSQDIERGGTFVYGLPEKPDTPNVLTLSSVYSGVAVYQVYEYGVSLDPMTQEIKPNVFTDWTIEEGDQPDVYANVRDGLTWNDGEEFTAEDAAFTYQYISDNEPGQWATLASNVASAQVPDNDWDVHIKLSQPIGVWESNILGGAPLLPKHKWEDVDYQSYNPMEENDNGPVGLGPGRLTRFDPDTSMQVTLDNEYYFDTLAELDWIQEHDQLIAGGPFLDTINFKVYGSSNAMTQAFLQGEIDTHYGSMKTANIPDVEQADGQSLINGTDSGFSYHGYNLRRAPLDDVTFRQAMQFLWDDHYWTTRLMEDYVIKGDFAQTPGYPLPRPDYQYAGEDQVSSHPASNAYDFRQAQAAVPDVEGIRQFLTEGQVIDGSEGTYVGKDYPGSLSGVSASQSESKYDYSFGEVQSEILRNHDGADQEIRVDGQTIPEMMDGDPITMFIDPPQNEPKEAKAIQRWMNNLRDLGIPIQTQAIEFNTMSAQVFNQENFDIWPMGWGGTGPFGSSAFSFFHSSMADDHSEGNNEAFMYNSTGYGLHGGSADDLLKQAQETLDSEERNDLTAQALEKIYLDSPYFVWHYEKVRWPVNSADFQGFISGLVDPAYASFGDMLNNIHQTQ